MSDPRFFGRLSVRLTAAFLLSAVLGVGLVAFLTYQGAARDFRSYLAMVESMQGMAGGRGFGMMGGIGSQAAIDFMSSLGRTLWIAGLLGVLLALILGGIFTRHIVAPLAEITGAAKGAIKGQSLKPVSVRGSTEMVELATSFNTMGETINRNRELRENMVADIAHELRTPLSVLQANIEAMQDGVLDKNNENLATLHQETVLLSRLVDDLGTLSLAESGQLRMHSIPTDIGDLSARVVDSMQTQFGAKRVRLEIDRSQDVPAVLVDPDRIEQVLRNLISNALHYTPEGGNVSVRLGKDGEGLTVSVADTGPGIAPEEMPKLFERFYRVDRSRTRSTGGTGLGLAIVKQLVEAHGGRVWATSEVGKGSRFFVHIPMTTPTA